MDPTLLVNKLIDIFTDEGITNIPNILEIYGLLGYVLGMSIEGLDKPPTYEDLKQLYLEKESVGAALMLQGQMIRSWTETWIRQQQEKKKG